MKHYYTYTTILLILLFSPLMGKAQCYSWPATADEFSIISALPQPGACVAPQPIDRNHEMIHFVVGPLDLSIAQLNVVWASGITWQGVYNPDANTAAKVAAMNARLKKCGRLEEPVFPGLLPAGSQVVLISDTAYNPAILPFSHLQDTLYVIFQKPGNAAEHMPNFTGTPSMQHTILDFGGTHKDSASYDRSKIGQGIQVRYPAPGMIEYASIGCHGAYNKVYSEAGTGGTICQGFKFNLNGAALAGSCYRWSGGTGRFGDSSKLVTTYTPSNSELGAVKLFLTAISKCDTFVDSLILNVNKGYNLSAGSGYVLCRGFSVFLQGQADVSVTSVKWTTSGSGAFSDPNIRSPLYTPGPSDTTCITLVFTATGSCGTLSDSIKLCVNPDPTADAGIGGAFCKPATIALNGSATNYTKVKWMGGAGSFSSTNTLSTNYTVDPSESGIVILTFRAYNACDSVSDTVRLYIYDPPTLNGGPDITICANQNVKFTGASSSFGNISWTTPDGTGNFQSGTDTIINSTYVPGATDGGSTKTFYVTINTPCGSKTDTVLVNFGAPPDASFSGLLDFYCEGDPATTFTGFVAGGTFSGTNVSGTSFNPVSAGTFVVTHTLTSNGCTDIKLDTTVVYPKPSATINHDPDEPEVLKDVTFSADIDTGVTIVSWDFGDGTTSSETAPVHKFGDVKEYTVKLVVRNKTTGCIDTVEIQLLVSGPEDLKVPNVFTPNNDGYNDSFRVEAQNLRSLEMTIFNRWGQIMYSTNDIRSGWDGTSSGADAPAGTYYLILSAEGKSGKKYNVQGSVTLIRQ